MVTKYGDFDNPIEVWTCTAGTPSQVVDMAKHIAAWHAPSVSHPHTYVVNNKSPMSSTTAKYVFTNIGEAQVSNFRDYEGIYDETRFTVRDCELCRSTARSRRSGQ
jgi:hypothetical protein